MSAKGKMRGALKGTGTCTVPGHGQSCCVTQEIRENVTDRAREKRSWRRDAEAELPVCSERGEAE